MRNAVIAGDRLYLRLIERDDAAFMVDTVAGETETGSGRMPTSALAMERWIEERTSQAPPHELPFGLCRRSDDALIGIFSLRDIDWVNRTAETGSALFHAADRGHGIGTEAKHLLLAYAFDMLHLHAVRSHVAGWNARSAAALRKQGYRLAGYELCDAFHDGEYHDGMVWVLLAREWRALRASAVNNDRLQSASTR